MGGTPSKLEVEGIDKYNAHAKTLSENRAKTIRKSNRRELRICAHLISFNREKALGAP